MNIHRRGSKYTWLYQDIKKLEVGKTMAIKLDTIKEGASMSSGIRQAFKEEVGKRILIIAIRKYTGGGNHAPKLYVSRQE